MDASEDKGVLSIKYAGDRETSRVLRYRLWRRTREVLSSIDEFATEKILRHLRLNFLMANQLLVAQK